MQAGELFVKLGLDMTAFSKGLEDAKRTLESQSREWGNIGSTLSMAFTAPMVAIGVASVTMSAQFEKAMNKIQALSYDTSTPIKQIQTEMAQMSELALKLGKDTIFSAKEVADAMGEMAAAGFSAQQIMEGMAGVTALAAAGQLKLAEAANIAAAVLQGFGIDATGMVQVADQMAKAAAMSAISVQDIGNAFKYVGPAAKAAGWSLAEVNAALVVLGNAGIRGEMGGTAVRNMISDLIAPSKQAAEIMKTIGIQTMDSSGKFMHLADIVDQLREKNLGLADGFKIWGVRFSEVLPLIQAGGDKLRGYTDEIARANGEAKRMADTMRQGLAGMWEELSGSVETLAIAIGKVLQPAVEPVVQLVTMLANKLIDMVSEFDKSSAAMKIFVGILIGIPVAIGPIALAISGMMSVMSAVAALGSSVAAGIAAIGVAASAATAAIAGLPAAISAIAYAVSNNMVGALSAGETALLNLGRGVVIAAAAFAGWKLGNWLYETIPAIKEFSNAFGDIFVHKTGIGTAALFVTGKLGELQKWITSTNAKLKEHGIVIQKGSMDWVTYAEAIRAAADKAGVFKTALAGSDLSLKGIEGALNGLETASAKTFSSIMNGMALGSLSAQDQKMKMMELNNVIADVNVMHGKLNQSRKEGKITQEQYLAAESKLASVMQLAKSTMTSLTGATGKQTNAYAGLRAAKESTSSASLKLAQSFDKLATSGNKIADALATLPKTIKDIADAASKVDVLPKDWQEQANKIEKLKTLYKELFRDMVAAQHDGNVALSNGLKDQVALVGQAIKQQEKLFEGFKSQDAADSLQKVGEAIDRYMIQKFDDAISKGVLLGDTLSSSFSESRKEIESWGDALDFFGVKSMQEYEDAAKKSADAMAKINEMRNLGIIGERALKDAALENLRAQIELGRQRGENVAEMLLAERSLQAELDKMDGKTRKVKNEWTDLWNQISTIVTDLGKDLTEVIWAGKNLGETFVNALESIGKAVTRFIIEGSIKGMLKMLQDNTKEANIFGKALDNLMSKITGDGKTPIPKIPIPGSSTNPTDAVNKAKEGWGSLLSGGLLGAITAIGTAISAIFDVLAYFQSRRMEQDIGRIEVTTRGILNQVIAQQDSFNRYLPGLDGINDFLWGTFAPAFASLMDTAEQSRDILAALFEKMKDGLVTTSSGENTGAPVGSSGSQTLTGSVINKVLQDLDSVSGAMTTVGYTLGNGAGEIFDAAYDANVVIDSALTSGAREISDSANDFTNTTNPAWIRLTDSLDETSNAVWSSVVNTNLATIALTETLASQEAYITDRLLYLQTRASGNVAAINQEIYDLTKQLNTIKNPTAPQTQWNGYNASLPQAGITFLPGGNLFNAAPAVPTLLPNQKLELTVNVNNADAKQVADTMVESWRRAGVNL